MNKKKIVKITAIVVAAIALVIGGIFGVRAYIRHKNVAETGNVLGVAWYNETDKEFTITTVEELYEFAELSKFYDFSGQTIYLGADLVVNEGDAENWAEDAPAKRWNPIDGFAGRFDGKGHTISGLYGKGFERRMALFINTQMSCSVKNVSLVNTYFQTSGHRGTASFVSNGGGKFSKLYSDAIIVHKGENVGGIASFIDVQSTFEECWFDGDISITGRDCGGVIDEIMNARVTMKHCLFSGHIYSSYDVGGTRTGGLVGRADQSATVIISDSLSSGVIDCDKDVYTGAVIGASYSSVQWTISDTYTSEDTYANIIGRAGERGTFTGSTLAMRTSELTGVKAYQWTSLNFDEYWAVVEDGTPILKNFAETILSLEGVEKVYDISWYTPGGYDFTIMTREQLYGLFIKSASTDFQDCKVKLGADIVVNDGKASNWQKEEPEMPWYPIALFAGQFDGQGHTISGLYTKSSGNYLGLFKRAIATSTIQNVNLKNSYFEHVGTTDAYMGSIVGETYGIIQNVYSNAILVSEGYQVGGIAGRLNDNTSTSSNRIIGEEDYAVVSDGWFDGSITMLAWKEEATGACEAGGIVGRVVQGDAIIEHCLNTGTITSNVTGRALMVGGIVGYVVNAGQLQIADCLNTGAIQTDYNICVGSAVGRINNDKRIVNVTDTYASKESSKVGISKNAFKGVLNGGVIRLEESWLLGYKGYQYTTLDFNNYWAVVIGPDGTPILSKFATKDPSVKGIAKMVDFSWYKADAKEMVIDSLADLYGFAMLSATTDFAGQTVKLGADIVVNPVDATTLEAWKNGTQVPANRWLTIGSYRNQFAGTFDGQGHTISGVYSVSDEQYNGLFGVTTTTSMVKNFSLKDSYFAFTESKVTEEGKDAAAYLGSIAGDLRGDLDSVYSNAIVTSTAGQVGGLVGRANGHKVDEAYTTCTINNCWFDGQVILTGETARFAGGIAGVAVQGTVEFTNCLNSGSVSNERLVSGQFLGGIVGADWSSHCTVNIKGCLNTGSITAKYVNCIGSIVGRIQKSNSVFTISDVYATKESCTKTDGTPVAVWSIVSGATVNGGAAVLDKSFLLGYGGYQFTTLDFDQYFVVAVSPEGTPILKTFASNVPSLEGVAKLIDISWYSADAKEFEIDSAAKLYGFSILSSVTNFSGQTVKLTKSLALDSSVEWLPIGSASKPFAGTFDGGMNTISGMYVDSQASYVGMFAVTAPTSMIKNLSLLDSTFIYSGLAKNGKEEVGAYIGSIAGDLRGDLDTVYSNATVTSVATQAGGLVGRANGATLNGEYTTCTINNCWFDGKVLMTGEIARYAGGIAGVAVQGNIEIMNCLNAGDVSCERDTSGRYLGGILGADWTSRPTVITIDGCLNTGSVTAPNPNCIGAIVGRLEKASTCKVTNTYAMKGSCLDKNNKDRTIYSYNADATVQNETVLIAESELLGVEAYKWTNLDFNEKTGWWAAREAKVPGLRSFVSAENIKSVADVIKPDTSWYDDASEDTTDYYIKTEGELYGFAQLVNSGITFEDKTIHLIKDLDLNPSWKDGAEGTPVNEWVPIGQYKTALFDGTFDGLYEGKIHRISGLYCINNKTDESYVGLFGVTGSGSAVQNLIISNSYFERTAAHTNGEYQCAYIGSVAGDMRGTLDTVYSEATVKSSYQQTGGLVGRANGVLIGGVATTAAIQNCWFNGKVVLSGANGIYAGGIAGVALNMIQIDNCLNTGTVTSTGVTTGDMYIGGIIGTNFNSKAITNITNTLNLGEVKADGEEVAMGSIYGKQNKGQLNVTNTYASNESFIQGDTGVSKGNGDDTLNSEITLKANADLQGTKAYENTLLDFYVSDTDTGAWVARIGDDPALKSFLETVVADNEMASLEGVKQNGWYSDDIDTYYIGTLSAFEAFRDYVNDGKTFDRKTVYLTDDIDLNPGWIAPADTTQTVDESADTWTPIGRNGDFEFKGVFDGQGHTIRGLYINRNGTYNGLFGCANGATIRDFVIRNSYIKQTGSDKYWTGSVVGLLWYGGSISKVYSDAVIVAEGAQIGGIAGRAESSVTECWFDGEIKGTYVTNNRVSLGGIVGSSNATTDLSISNCLNTGDIIYNVEIADVTNVSVGGIYGGTTGKTPNFTVEHCINSGTITKHASHIAGAVVGLLRHKVSYSINNCYVREDSISGQTVSAESGILGGDTSGSSTEVALSGVARALTAMQGDVVYKAVKNGGMDLDYEEIWIARTSDVPVPRCFVGNIVESSATVEDNSGRVYADTSWLTDGTGDGTQGSPYKIDSAGELLGLAQTVNAGTSFSGKYIQLTRDIDYNVGWTVAIDEATGALTAQKPRNEWTPIGTSSNSFKGIFDGDNHEIRGIYQDASTENNGLFGYVEGATICNLELVNSYFNSTEANLGSIVGHGYGTLNNVYSEAVLKTTNECVGGLIGYAQSGETNVVNCEFAGRITSSFTLTGYIGGLIGRATAATTDIRDSDYTGAIVCLPDVQRVGGILGSDNSNAPVTITNCVVDGTMSGSKYMASVVGYGRASKTTVVSAVVNTSKCQCDYVIYYKNNTDVADDSNVTLQ